MKKYKWSINTYKRATSQNNIKIPSQLRQNGYHQGKRRSTNFEQFVGRKASLYTADENVN
jgi:hypothetical protein